MRINKSLITYIPSSGSGSGSVTSVALTAPTGFSVSGSPITSSGTLALSFAAGYSLPTTTKQGQWDSAYAFTSTFPTGTAQQLLRVNTLGTALEFFTPNFLVSTDIIATTPLVWNSTTKTMSIPAATSSVNGYLTSADWLTFSSKQPAITLTTTGNNGSATLIGATLNIPTYTLVGLGGMSNPFTTGIGQMIYSNGAGAPLSLAPNTSTTKKYLSMTGDGTNGDAPVWDTITGFIGGSGTTGYIPKFTASGTIGNSIIAESSGIATIYGAGQVYSDQTGAGTTTLFVTNQDTTAAITHQTRLVTQQLGSGIGRTVIQAASNTTGTTRGQFGITDEGGSNLIMALGTAVTTTDYSMSLYTTSGIEQIRLNTNGNSFLNGGRLVVDSVINLIGAENNSAKIKAGKFLSIADDAFNVGVGYTSDSIPVGGYKLYVSGNQYINGIALITGQLKLSGYTSVSSYTGTIAGLLAFDSSGNVIARNNVVDLTLSTTGNSGSATYNTVTGALNIPTYTLSGLGGMANVFTSLGDLVYSNAAGAPLRLAGNTTTTKKFLSQTGDGVSSDAPFWTTLSVSDVSGAVGLTAFSASSPLAYNNTTGAFSIQVANVSQNGYLSSSDWTTFNSKQTQITLTTTGSSGASTFNFSTGALNIPEYTLAGLGGLSNPMTSLGDMLYSNSSGAPQRLSPNTTTTRKYLSMLGDGTFGAIPTWETINSLTGTGTSGYITYWNGTSSVTASANLVFDATNTRFGLGISTPSVMTHFRAANGATIMRMENSDTIVSLGETIGKIEFYGNDVGAGSGVTAYIDCRATSINGDNAIDIFSGSNGNVIGGVSVLPSGAVNFTPIATPATAAAGDVYYDSSTNKLRCYDGTNWNDLF